MILDTLLDQVIELLQHPEFKNFGALQKSKFQNSKSEDEIFLRSDMYKGCKQDPAVVAKVRKLNKKRGKNKVAIEKAAKSRTNWYKDPKNKEKFLAALRKRDYKKAMKNKK